MTVKIYGEHVAFFCFSNNRRLAVYFNGAEAEGVLAHFALFLWLINNGVKFW